MKLYMLHICLFLPFTDLFPEKEDTNENNKETLNSCASMNFNFQTFGSRVEWTRKFFQLFLVFIDLTLWKQFVIWIHESLSPD